ncbi:MAG: flagellar basal body P-ring protein FlgI [Pseudomonadota bacterium]|nr:flagellar basal body P-ring protein FlgI [Pseudomonadota bacterium]MDE3038373.1 flagellar basal body P-ring protein FlgI [Pseudomonadota bacterium]
MFNTHATSFLQASSQHIWEDDLDLAWLARKFRVGLRRLASWFFVLALLACPSIAHADARLKDIANFEGVRDNMLMGYGLVVGLDGTGDKLTNNAFTEQSLIAFLERQGVNTRGTPLKTKNVAAVTVTATLPPFSRNGSRIDVTVSAMGDAKDLTGGTLLATPLYGADGDVYAVAQGQISIGGFKAGDNATTITKGVPTSGFVTDGGIVEKEVNFALDSLPSLKLALHNPDITTAENVANVINEQVAPGLATVLDPGTVTLTVPAAYHHNVTQLLADIEKLEVKTDQPARIVIDEASGTIVMGENVRIDTVAVAQGNLVVKIEQQPPAVSQPQPLSEGQTVAAAQTTVTVDEGATGPGRRMAVLSHGATLKDLVEGLNALGVGPRDLITILQTIKAAGALQAEIQTR